MKDPKRYTLVQINDEHWMHENKNRMNAAPVGEYVLFDDYARLKAEVERLTVGLNDQGRAFLRLLAENEYLRKAGDAIVKDNKKWLTNHDNIKAWNAAKDGNDAE